VKRSGCLSITIQNSIGIAESRAVERENGNRTAASSGTMEASPMENGRRGRNGRALTMVKTTRRASPVTPRVHAKTITVKGEHWGATEDLEDQGRWHCGDGADYENEYGMERELTTTLRVRSCGSTDGDEMSMLWMRSQ